MDRWWQIDRGWERERGGERERATPSCQHQRLAHLGRVLEILYP
jgi:hypothetical protein